MKIKASSIFLIFILVLMVLTTAMSISYRSFDATLAPLLLSLIIFVLAAIELITELRANIKKKEEPVSDQSPEKKSEGFEWNLCGTALAWISGFAMGIYLLGFYLGVPLFALVYMKKQGRGLFLSILFGGILTFFIFIIFEVGLKSQLYRGLLFMAF